MKRPFAVLGFTYLAALTAALFLGADISFFLSGVLLALFIFSLAIKKIRKKIAVPFVMITASVAILSFSLFVSVRVNPAETLNNTEQRVTATLCEEAYESSGRYYYPLEVVAVDGSELSGFKILASSSYVYDVDVYDELNANISLYQNADSVFGNYDISRGYFLRGSILHFDGVTVKHNEDKPICYYAIELRRAMKDTIEKYLPDDCANLISGIMLGDKHGISPDDKANFSSAGVSHLIAVSGFHVTVVAQLFLLLFTALLRKRRIAAGVAMLAVLVFMAVTGFSPTVIRAGIMQMIFLLGLIIFRSPEPFNSLGLSVLIICLFNPYSGADFGFLMSVGATLGIFVCGGKIKTYIVERMQRKKLSRINSESPKQLLIEKEIQRFISSAASVISVTISATVFTLPVTIIVFKQFPLYTVLTNLLISYPASIMLIVGIAGVLFHFTGVLSFLSYPLMLVCGIIAKYILYCVEFIADLPFSVIQLNYSFVPIWLAAMIIVFLLCLWCRKCRFAIRFTAVTSVISLLVLVIAYNVYCSNRTSIYIAESNDGINIAVNSGGNTAVVTYGGSKAYDMFDYFDTSAVGDIDYLLIAETGAYDTMNAEYILKNYSVRSIGIYNEEKAREKLSRLLQNTENVIKYHPLRKNIADLGTCVVTSIETESGIFTHCTFGGDFDILIIPNGGDCAKVPHEWLNSSVCVLGGLPQNYNLLKPAAVVLSCIEENVSRSYGKLSEICENIYLTCYEKNIRMRIAQSGSISIWSEDNWLS